MQWGFFFVSCSQNNILRSLFTFLTFAYCSLPNTHTLPVSQLQSPTILKKNIKIQMEFFLFRKQWNNNNRKSNNHTKGVCLTPHHIRCRSPCHVILTPTRYVSVVMMMMIIALNNNIASNQRAVCVCVTPPTRTEKKKKKISAPNRLQMEWMMMIFRSVPAALHEIAFCVFLLLLLLLLFGPTSFLSISHLCLLYREKLRVIRDGRENSSMGWNGNKRKKKRRKKQSGNNSLVSFLFL